jgi:hypothetical protein
MIKTVNLTHINITLLFPVLYSIWKFDFWLIDRLVLPSAAIQPIQPQMVDYKLSSPKF